MSAPLSFTPPAYVETESQAALRVAVERLVEEQELVEETMTALQLSSAIRQAIEAGDFIRYVRAEPSLGHEGDALILKHAQQVVYLPGYGMDALRTERNSLASRVALLESILEEARIDVPCDEDAR